MLFFFYGFIKVVLRFFFLVLLSTVFLVHSEPHGSASFELSMGLLGLLRGFLSCFFLWVYQGCS